MLACDNGFEVDIELGDNTSLDFCFRNSNGEWDNNENNNYVIQIKEKDTSLVVTDIGELSLRPRLRRTYIWSKKIKLAIYKLMNSLPRFITGNYRRRINL